MTAAALVHPRSQSCPSRTTRVSEVGVREIDKVANREGLVRSEAIRLLLAFAVRQIPKGWRG
jgi:hypothetical protein